MTMTKVYNFTLLIKVSREEWRIYIRDIIGLDSSYMNDLVFFATIAYTEEIHELWGKWLSLNPEISSKIIKCHII